MRHKRTPTKRKTIGGSRPQFNWRAAPALVGFSPMQLPKVPGAMRRMRERHSDACAVGMSVGGARVPDE